MIERLVDRALILQQAALQPEDTVTTRTSMRSWRRCAKDIPACKQYHCETDEGWQKFWLITALLLRSSFYSGGSEWSC